MHGLKSAIDRGADAWARSLPGRVLDRYVSRSGPLLANGLAYGLLFAFFAGVWIAVSVLVGGCGHFLGDNHAAIPWL